MPITIQGDVDLSTGVIFSYYLIHCISFSGVQNRCSDPLPTKLIWKLSVNNALIASGIEINISNIPVNVKKFNSNSLAIIGLNESTTLILSSFRELFNVCLSIKEEIYRIYGNLEFRIGINKDKKDTMVSGKNNIWE